MARTDEKLDKIGGEKVHGSDAEVFIQWMDTDVCINIHCSECEAHCHFDGEDLYYARCAHCGTAWKLGTQVKMIRLDPEEVRSLLMRGIQIQDVVDEDRDFAETEKGERPPEGEVDKLRQAFLGGVEEARKPDGL